jgi:hypothetical protein
VHSDFRVIAFVRQGRVLARQGRVLARQGRVLASDGGHHEGKEDVLKGGPQFKGGGERGDTGVLWIPPFWTSLSCPGVV